MAPEVKWEKPEKEGQRIYQRGTRDGVQIAQWDNIETGQSGSIVGPVEKEYTPEGLTESVHIKAISRFGDEITTHRLDEEDYKKSKENIDIIITTSIGDVTICGDIEFSGLMADIVVESKDTEISMPLSMDYSKRSDEFTCQTPKGSMSGRLYLEKNSVWLWFYLKISDKIWGPASVPLESLKI